MAEAAGAGAGGLDGHLEGMIEHVMGQIRETFASANGNATQSFESPYDFAMGFIHAVDWRERWIQGLIAAEASLLAVAVLTRKWQTVQCVIFVLTMLPIYFAERINTFCQANWERFAGQDYFDKHGFFISMMLSTPLVLVLMVILVLQLIETSRLMVKVKRMELRRKRQGRGTANASVGEDGGEGSRDDRQMEPASDAAEDKKAQ